VAAAVSVTGQSGITITTNDGGSGGRLSFSRKGHVRFANLASTLTINGLVYRLEGTLDSLATDIAHDPSGAFALVVNYKSKDNFVKPPIGTFLKGTLAGLGNTISNLTINTSSAQGGLFASTETGSSISDLNLVNANIVVTSKGSAAGVLVGGASSSTITGCHVSGVISLGHALTAGGLVGINSGTISDSDADVTITMIGGKGAGGLAGSNANTITESFATGSVKDARAAGGLVGENGGVISNSYAIGASHGVRSGGLIGTNGGGAAAEAYSTGYIRGKIKGGLIGYDDHGVESNAYWDLKTSGINNPSQGAGNIANDPGITGLTTQQLQSGLPAGFDPKIWAEDPNINNGLPYLINNPPPK
jgi:hypothetical protein